MPVTLKNNPLVFNLDASVTDIYVNGVKYRNGELTKPLNISLDFATLDDKPQTYPFISNAVWVEGQPLKILGPNSVSYPGNLHVVPLETDKYRHHPPTSEAASTTSAVEEATPSERWVFDGDRICSTSDFWWFYKNWRCGPKHIPLESDVFNILLKGYDRFGGKEPLDFLEQYYPENTSNVIWPDHKGFDQAATVETIKIQVGELIDRFGKEDTNWYGKAGITYAQRSLPPSSLNFLGANTIQSLQSDEYLANKDHDGYRVYEVLKEVDAEVGKIAPWFHQSGGGLQFITLLKSENGDGKMMTPRELCDEGYLKRLPWAEVVSYYKKLENRLDPELVKKDIHLAVREAAAAVEKA